jgi:hypothetical protein
MLVVFANNQTLVANTSTTTTVTTDPVAIGDNNRATGITNIHAIFNAVGLSWQMQVSNDGQNWVTQGPELAATAATGTTLQDDNNTVSAVYARLQILFQASGGGIGAAIFDVHVNFDRA